MTLDLISRAEARIAEIKQQRLALDYEEFEIETALKVLHRFLGESTTQIPSNSGPDEAKSANLSTTSDPAQEPQPSAPAPAAQTGTEPCGACTSEAEPEAVASSASIPSIDVRSRDPNDWEDQDWDEGQPIQPETATETEAPFDNPADPLRSEAATREDAVAGASDSTTTAPVTLTPTIAPITLKDRIIALREEHPDWSSKQAAEHLGAKHASVKAYGSILGFKWPAEESLIDRIKDVLAEHPDWTARQIADQIGSQQKHVNSAAARAGIQLRRLSPEEIRETRRTGKPFGSNDVPPSSPAEPADARNSDASPEVPEKAKSSPQPIPAPARALQPKPISKPSSARFYVIDGKGRFLHYSLEKSPTDDGPLMTSNRHWAWYDNEQRFNGAAKLWPEILEMRKEYPQL